jgi:hypothetical protein
MSDVKLGRLPGPARWGSLLLGLSAGLAAVMLAATLAAWRHFGPAAVAYRSAFLDAGMDELETQVLQVRSSLAYNATVLAVTVLTTAGLALLIRRPLRWAQISTWCAAVVLGIALVLALNGGPDPAGSTPGPQASPVERLGYDLIPQWYTSVNAVLGLLLLAAVIAAAVLLARSSVLDFYRPESRVSDPRWESFVQTQRDRIVGGAAGTAGGATIPDGSPEP